MEGASLAISICAFVFAPAGFGWTIYEWRGSGARLEVLVAARVEVFKRVSPWDFGSDTKIVAIEVTNTGRTATTVHTVGLVQRGIAASELRFDRSSELRSGSTPLPGRLEPGETVRIHLFPRDLMIDCTEQGLDYAHLQPFAICGHGQFKGAWTKAALELMRSAEADDEV